MQERGACVDRAGENPRGRFMRDLWGIEEVTSVVPLCEGAHRTARYGTINLLWLFGHSQQSARAARPAGVGSTAAANPL